MIDEPVTLEWGPESVSVVVHGVLGPRASHALLRGVQHAVAATHGAWRVELTVPQGTPRPTNVAAALSAMARDATICPARRQCRRRCRRDR